MSTPNGINGTHAASSSTGGPKRIIVCCDGTWMNSLGEKGGDPPSNVTRISRVIRRTCLDNTAQVILYHPGVGSGGTKFDQFTGGAFGMGLDRDIREIYNFICNNYVDGDAIILTGFSRGAFTARSVADMIASVGLLTTEGLDHFYAIFDDYENIGDEKREASSYLFTELTALGNTQGKARVQVEEQRKQQYRAWLKEKSYTRDTNSDGSEIKIKALGVWDTFTNTQISDKVENAFQALALDEPRYAFRPSLWERAAGNQTNLKQVWFPGNHGGVGGGWHDQQIANITLAWMCDQLSSIGVEFNLRRMKETFQNGLSYSARHPYPFVPQPKWKPGIFQPDSKPWALQPICVGVQTGQKCDAEDCKSDQDHQKPAPAGSEESLWATARPWALGQTRAPTSWVQSFAGTTVRHPGMFKRVDQETNADTEEPLLNTNERIHSSVRVRLACGGLEMDDKEVWACNPMIQGERLSRNIPFITNGSYDQLWKLEKRSGLESAEAATLRTYKPNELKLGATEYGQEKLYETAEEDGEWRWVFKGTKKTPYTTVLAEEPMVGYWERLLLGLTAGTTDVWKWAQKNAPKSVMAQV